MTDTITYYREYRKEHREEINAYMKEYMQIRRAKQRADRIEKQRNNPQPAQIVHKSM